jgi:hypothetical protein
MLSVYGTGEEEKPSRQLLHIPNVSEIKQNIVKQKNFFWPILG